MVISGPNHTFPVQAMTNRLTSASFTYFHLDLTTTLLESAEGRSMHVEIISRSICRKVLVQDGIELATPESAVRLVTNCT